jgi:glycosyltransferase involved in cell wall biosynthesis
VSDAPQRLRVLLVSANYKPSIGGIERYVENLAQGLAARGYAVTVAACRTNGGPRLEQDGDVRIVRIPATDVLDEKLNVPYPLPNPVAAWRTLRRAVAKADVVHVHDALYATSVLSLALARRANVPTVLTQHVAFVPQRRRSLDAAQHVAIATLGRSARLATRVVTYNPAVANWAQATWGLSDVPVLPPGVPEAPQVDRGEDRFIALFVGRDVPKKGLNEFLGAADPTYDLLAVTDRAPSAAPQGTRILPFLEPRRFRELLACVDVFVLPSEGEGFPLALQEALVTGVPCVVTPGAGYDHFLREDEALLVRRDADEIHAALRKLAASGQLRKELGRRAQAAGQREFGLARFVAGYEHAYQDALETAGRISPR